MISKLVLAITLALGLGVGVAFAQDPLIQFIRVTEVSQLVKQDMRITFVDVRSRQEYLIQHIKGAVSIPASALDARFREIPREGLVVLY
jgi:rhodanese-related sulfurtransferase